jgi:DNA-binding transcriptional LysR family regulator
MTTGLGSANSAAESGTRRAGVPLLERAGRRVALTAAGTVLVGYAESALAVLLEEASAALAAARISLTGPLRIGAFPTAARTILPPALVTLGREHSRAGPRNQGL